MSSKHSLQSAQSRGFTLVELLIVIAIIGTVISLLPGGWRLPSLETWTNRPAAGSLSAKIAWHILGFAPLWFFLGINRGPSPDGFRYMGLRPLVWLLARPMLLPRPQNVDLVSRGGRRRLMAIIDRTIAWHWVIGLTAEQLSDLVCLQRELEKFLLMKEDRAVSINAVLIKSFQVTELYLKVLPLLRGSKLVA